MDKQQSKRSKIISIKEKLEIYTNILLKITLYLNNEV